MTDIIYYNIYRESTMADNEIYITIYIYTNIGVNNDR